MVITGGPGDETLNGTAGNDVIDGGGGADTMIGLAGNDRYYVDNAGDQVIEAVGGGSDNVYARVGYTLAAGQEVEFLRVYGSAGLTLTGNELANYLIGGAGSDTLEGKAGNDTLYGGLGADTMTGGSGDDVYYVDNAADQVIEVAGGGSDNVYTTVSYTLAAGQEIEFLRVYGSAGHTLTGNELANYLIGSSGDDTLNGGAGSDTLYGGLGTDAMAGGSGNDTYFVDMAGDQVIEAVGDGSDTVYATVSYALAAGLEVEFLRVYGSASLTLTGNGLANYLIGGSGSDTLNGGGGDDRLDGGFGADAMTGGSGNDFYYVDNVDDQVIETAGGGSDNVYASVSYTLAAGQEVEFLRVYGTASLTLTGNELANYLIGGSGNDTLNGGAGNDTLYGGLGADMMAGGSGNDLYYVDSAGDQVIEAAGGGSDNVYASVSYTLAAGQEVEFLRVYGTASLTLTGNELANYLIGGSGNDTLNGAGGDDTLYGGLGADTMTGGSGNDLYYVDSVGDQVVEAAGGGSDTIYAGIDFTLGVGQEVEYLQVYGSSGLTLTGNELANYLIGGSASDTLNGAGGDDTLFGGLGADAMAGGSGNDIYYVDSAGDQVVEAAGGGSDKIYTSIDFALGAGQEVEVLAVYGSSGLALAGNELANYLSGGAGNDALNGNDGDDTLYGGFGADAMAGGSGNDLYYVDSPGDQVVEAAGGGSDTIYASASYALAAGQEVEFVRVSGPAGLTLAGNELANALFGGAGTDTLNGGAGNDSLDGGAAKDTLNGGDGGDTLFGGLGADAMAGGSGNDSYFVDNTGDQVIEAVGGGTDTVNVSVDWTLAAGQEVESLSVSVASGLTLTGNELANSLFGAAGNDTFYGGGGNDTLDGDSGDDRLAGGDGDDTYYVDTAGDQVIEAVGGGTDTVITTVSYQLADGQQVEVLQVYKLSTQNISLDGNGLANHLIGASGNDSLDGRGGADTMAGGKGDDSYYVDNAGDAVSELAGEGSDTIYASVDYVLAAGSEVEFLQIDGENGLHLTGNDFGMGLVGGNGDDTLTGGAGDDHIMGGAGADIIDGGAGADVMDGGDFSQGNTFHVDNAGDQIVGNVFNSTIYTSVDWTVGPNTSDATVYAVGSTGLHLTVTGGGIYRLFGAAGDDVLTGGGFINSLDGGAGADIMIGGADADYYYVDNAGDQVIEAPIDNIIGKFDTIYASVDYTLAAGQEVEYMRVALGSGGLHLTGNDSGMQMFGGDGSDTLTGGAGDDSITGGAGADIMDGGGGQDTAIYSGDSADYTIADSGGGSFSVAGPDGTDTLISIRFVQFTDRTITLGAADITSMGTSGDDTLGGGEGNDILLGLGGRDTLNGLDGNDRLEGGSGDDGLNGGANDDTLLGDDGADMLAGGGGDDQLTGDEGNDALDGGDGRDTLMGGAGDDILEGGRGGDILDGGAGADIMRGGRESDTYYVDNAGDQVIDPFTGIQNESADIVYTSVDYTLADGQAIESLSVQGAAGLHLTGNDYSLLTLTGGAGSDMLTAGSNGARLDGGAGADILIGGAHDDTFFVDDAGDQVIDSGGVDTLYALADYTLAAGLEIEALEVLGEDGVHLTGNDHAASLSGSGGDDTITGGAGNDRISGGWQGNDVLVGGGGIDTFVCDSSVIFGDVDSIQDFDASNETIEISRFVFTGLTAGTLAANQFSLNGPTGSNAQIVYDTASGALSFRPQTGEMMQFATIANHASLSASNFIVS